MKRTIVAACVGMAIVGACVRHTTGALPCCKNLPMRVGVPTLAKSSLRAFGTEVEADLVDDGIGAIRMLNFRDWTSVDAVAASLRADGYVVQVGAPQLDKAGRLRFTRPQVFGDMFIQCGGACADVRVRYQIVELGKPPSNWTTVFDNISSIEYCRESLRTCQGNACSRVADMCAPSFAHSPDFPFPAEY